MWFYLKEDFLFMMHSQLRLLPVIRKPWFLITMPAGKLKTHWIEDPLLFLQTVRDINGAQARLDDVIYSELRVDLGKFDMSEIVSQKRTEIMQTVTERSNEKSMEYGINIVDVRIKRADLPTENEQNIFARMEAERERIAKQYRAEGREEAAKIVAETEREKTVILAEAYKEAQNLQGEGEAESIRIYAESFNQDPQFYQFLRTLESYENTSILIK